LKILFLFLNVLKDNIKEIFLKRNNKIFSAIFLKILLKLCLFVLLALFALNILVFSLSNIQIYIYLVLSAKIFGQKFQATRTNIFIICINLETMMNRCLYDIFINFRIAIKMLFFFFSRTVLTCDNFHECVRNLYERSL